MRAGTRREDAEAFHNPHMPCTTVPVARPRQAAPAATAIGGDAGYQNLKLIAPRRISPRKFADATSGAVGIPGSIRFC
jgi:hypothetical protein